MHQLRDRRCGGVTNWQTNRYSDHAIVCSAHFRLEETFMPSEELLDCSDIAARALPVPSLSWHRTGIKSLHDTEWHFHSRTHGARHCY